MSGFAKIVLAVIGVVSTAAWALDVAEHHHPINYWLVVVLAILLVAAIWWGLSKPKASEGGVHHHYAPGVTVQQLNSLSSVPQAVGSEPRAIGKTIEGTPDRYEIRTVHELAEDLPGQGSTLVGYTLRYVELRGPAVLAVLSDVTFDHPTLQVVNDDPESIIWDWGKASTKIGIVGIQNCLLRDCRTSNIGFTGSPETVTALRKQLREATGKRNQS